MRSPPTAKVGDTPVCLVAEESTTATTPTIPTSRVGPKTTTRRRRLWALRLTSKPDVPDRRQAEMALQRAEDHSQLQRSPTARESEFPVSRSGMNQESDHNKHNDPGQSGHKPQQPTVLEEKQNK